MEFLIGIDVTQVDDAQLYPVGALAKVAEAFDGKGDRIYVYVKFSAAATVGQVVLLRHGHSSTPASAFTAVLASTTNSAPGTGQGQRAAVAETAAASGQWGWVLVYGTASFNVLANCAAYTSLNTTGTGGALDDDASVGSEVVDGISLRTANGGSTAAVEGFLNFPRVGKTY